MKAGQYWEKRLHEKTAVLFQNLPFLSHHGNLDGFTGSYILP